MGLLRTLRKLLGLVEGREDQVAEQVSKRTSVSEEKARESLEKATDAATETDGSRS